MKHKVYISPAIASICTIPVQMLATSGDPEVRTTTEQASTQYDALVKKQTYDVWEDDWGE